MLTITAVDYVLVQLPPRRVHRWAGLTQDIGRYVLVKITLDSGVCGWGEATALPQWGGDHGRYYGEDPQIVLHLLQRYWAPLLLGARVDERATIGAAMERAVRGYPFARTAVESALLDARARAAGIPVFELLGGRRRDRVPVAHSIGLMPAGDAVREARQAADEGVGVLKLKVGEDRDRDVAVVHGVRAEVGDDVDLCIDANQGWRSPAEALAMIDAMAGARLRYVEQPVPGLSGLAAVARRSAVPVMADESVWTAYDLLATADDDRPPLVSVYLGKAGGPSGAMRLDTAAGLLGIGTNVNGSGETGVGNLANLHVAAAMSALREACVVPVTGLAGRRATKVAGAMYADDILVEPLDFVDGFVRVPDGPGWGIDVDPAKVDAYSVAAMSLSGSS